MDASWLNHLVDQAVGVLAVNRVTRMCLSLLKRKIAWGGRARRDSTPLQASVPTNEYAGFAVISAQLTGQDKPDPHLVSRCYRALCKVDARFEDRFRQLERAAQDFARPLMAHWGEFSAAYPEASEVAMAIISAWYLGYTGGPRSDCTEDDAQFVAYENALMYRSTIDATVIPSYARGKTNYWAEPPATIGQD